MNSEKKDDKIAVIDLDSILFAAGWGKKIPLKNGDFERDSKGRLIYIDKTEEEIARSLDSMMDSILNSSGATHYVAYVKGEGTSKNRRLINPGYKATRPTKSPVWWEFAKSYAINQWGALLANDMEADDAVNIARLMFEDSFIVAIDQDLLNLEGQHYNWRTEEWVIVEYDEALRFFWADMIAGQPGDNIKGIPGKGKAYCKKVKLNPITVFKEYIDYFGPVDGVEEYYKSYYSLKILDKHDGFEKPTPIKYQASLPEDLESLFN